MADLNSRRFYYSVNGTGNYFVDFVPGIPNEKIDSGDYCEKSLFLLADGYIRDDMRKRGLVGENKIINHFACLIKY